MPNKHRGLGRTGRPWRRVAARLRAEYPEGPCGLCGHGIDPTLPHNHPHAWTAHHRDSLATGGDPLAYSNLVPAHRGCNSEYGDGTRRRAPTPPLRTSRNW